MSNKIKKAIISISDKSEIKLILNTLKKYKVNIISSGGTSKKIMKLGYKCTEVSEYTRTNEILNGRVKTLHPKLMLSELQLILKLNSVDDYDLENNQSL